MAAFLDDGRVALADVEEVDVELLAGERTGEKRERYDENLGQIPPPSCCGYGSNLSSFILKKRARACHPARARSASEGSAFRWRAKQRICFSSFERLSQQQIPRYARVQRAALGMTTSPAPFERETRRTVATLWYSTSHQYEFFPILLFDPVEYLIPVSEQLDDIGLAGKRRRRNTPRMQLRERDPEHADQAIAIDQQSFTKRLLCNGRGRHESFKSSGLHYPSATRKRRLHARQIH